MADTTISDNNPQKLYYDGIHQLANNIIQIPSGVYTDSSFQYQGCASSGFCFNCEIYVTDSVCFCAGGKCPKCGNHVVARTIPIDTSKKYESINRNYSKLPE